MIPQLPPELIAHIQALAEDGERCTHTRLQTRNTFDLVNSTWHTLVDRFTHVLIHDWRDADRLARLVESDEAQAKAAAKTRLVEADLSSFDNDTELHNKNLINSLWGLKSCESVELYDSTGFLALGGPVYEHWDSEHGREACLYLCTALEGMSRLRHFSYTGSDDDVDDDGTLTSNITQEQLARLGSDWPNLVTLQLEHVTVVLDAASGSDRGLFSSFTKLKQLSVAGGLTPAALTKLVVGLPPTLTTLSIAAKQGLYNPATAPSIASNLGGLASRLVEFTVLTLEEECLAAHRGAYDPLIRALANVRKLPISPWAVSNLPALLAPLTHLRHLALVLREEYEYDPRAEALVLASDPFPAAEVGNLLRAKRGLERVDVVLSTGMRWGEEERVAVERAADGSGTELNWASGVLDKGWPSFYS